MEEEKKPLLFNLPYVKDLWEDREQIKKDCARIKEEMLQNLLLAQRAQDAVDTAKSSKKPFFFPEVVKETQEAWVLRCKPIFRNVLIADGLLDLYNWMNSVPGLKPTLDAARKNAKYERLGDVRINNDPFLSFE